MAGLLPKDRTILERGFMEFRPFGVTPSGEKIRDVGGTTVRANVEYLVEVVSRTKGPEAGRRAVEDLCRLLNERIRDRAYHVTPAFLTNTWNSYSYEFVCFLGEFCRIISGDPTFPFNVGMEKFISPIVQTLGRPFSVSQIYRMFAHFGEKFAKGSIEFQVGEVTDRSAILRMKFTERVYVQFGPYRRACAYLACQSAKAALAAVPERVHHLKAATITDRTCIANGDEYCEWQFTWTAKAPRRFAWPAAAVTAGLAAFAYLRARHPALSPVEAVLIACFPALAIWLAGLVREQRRQLDDRDRLIQEQLGCVDARHEELREAYLEQEQTVVELRHRIAQLTALHRAGLLFSSTLDPGRLIQSVLQAIVQDLRYDRAMLARFDPSRRLIHDIQMIGVPDDLATLARAIQIPVTDADSTEGTVLLQGKPVLIGDVQTVWDRLHPLHQQLAKAANAKSLLSVPLKVKDHVIGSLTVDRAQEHALTPDDLELMATVANQVAIALDNADAYRQIEALNVGLEAKIRERTAELERANERLRELDNLKSAFVSVVSHELRTPMTSIKGYVDNLLDGLAGGLTDKQGYYLNRVRYNIERLTRMINDLLDLSRIEARKVEMRWEPIALRELAADVVESLQMLARDKRITLTAPETSVPAIPGDRDKLHQVLTNLINNAIKFTPQGGTIRVDIQPSSDDWVQVSVTDTGCGIGPEEIGKVFDRFYRASSAPTEVRGAGLGLAITKSLVELHGGRIWVDSTLGQGSTFALTLPVRRP